MPFAFSQRSIDNLKDVHPDLVAVARLALKLTGVDFVVIDGLRTEEEHQANVAAGKSWTKHSLHQDGKAIDVAAYVNGQVSFYPVYFGPIASAFKRAAAELNIPIVWGGSWKQQDLGHFELDRKAYP